MDIVDYEYSDNNQVDYEIEISDKFITKSKLIEYFKSTQ
jgi:hypothetical protein